MLYAVMKPEGNKWVRYGRNFKSVTSAIRLSEKFNKSYVQTVGGGKDSGRIVFYNCERNGHLAHKGIAHV